jgi:arylsulfatase
MRRLIRLGLIAAMTGAASSAFAALPIADQRPDIVFILADNLGYGELGCYGGGVPRGAPTPRIDALAAQVKTG